MPRRSMAGMAAVFCLMAISVSGCATRRPEPLARPKKSPLIIPLDPPLYTVTSPFGERQGGFHQGMDLQASKDTPVLAAAAGTVVFSGKERGYGRIVKLDHGNGLMTAYAHLSSSCVNVRDVVRQGDRIGRVGASGNATAPHLHFEVHVNGHPVNPAPYIARYPRCSTESAGSQAR
ncbi:MAG TPA: M23 family metallopeptidase [Candidatus Hydrogenedentes bacterium]|nr:M23 family metallopeptidase [Candidatus Hydrogenedentota bacterium]HOV73897.1 M23 family metallopeptidase [Candidatus Hydrogenedentota bacterium]